MTSQLHWANISFLPYPQKKPRLWRPLGAAQRGMLFEVRNIHFASVECLKKQAHGITKLLHAHVHC